MLPLNDPTWEKLDHAYGPAGDVPDLLRALDRGEDRTKGATPRDDLWNQIWSALCHQGTVYSASYAAVPHVVAIGEARPSREQVQFWSFVGAIAGSRDAAPVPPALRSAYDAALSVAEERARACLADGISEADGAVLLVAIAELHGEPAVAAAIGSLIDGEIAQECPSCSTQLYITLTKLPYSVTDEDPVRFAKALQSHVEPAAPRAAIVNAAELARAAALDALAKRVSNLECVVTCPSCEARFSLVDEAGR